MSDKKRSFLSRIFKPKESSCCSIEIVDEDENKEKDSEQSMSKK